MPSEELNSYLASLIDRSNEITEIWLIGSRANGTARIDSDWDLLIFGNEQVLSELRSSEDLNCRDFDVLGVYDGNKFESPWQTKNGSLSSWEW
jgi:predicted nucleotidyltransferase